MQIISLNGSWTLLAADQPDEALPAQVPGCVHTDFLRAGKIDDPFYRDNEKQIQWIGRTDWIYHRTFEVTDAQLAHDEVLLRCGGLDTIATIHLNDEHLADTDNMFRTYEFDVKSRLVPGSNHIEIRFAAPTTYAERMDAERGAMPAWVEPMRTNSAAWIRKEPCNYGWDWGPVLTTSGIWRSIELVTFDTARISDVQVLQAHDAGQVTLTLNVAADAMRDETIMISARLERDGQVVAQATETELDSDALGQLTLTIEQPDLWWPSGMGEQPLYDLHVDLSHLGTKIDTWHQRIGLRTLTLERHDDEWGESFYFACNGVPFFAKGANWIPASPYPAETSSERYHLFVSAAAEANMNMLRVWGGGIYEEDIFYDLCDELGITVWQDFMFACGTYPSFDEDFMSNVQQEAIDNVKRLRHHACIALWCGNNEIEQGMPWDWKEVMTWADYERLFDQLLPEVVNDLDPQTAYWPGSPHSPRGDREDWENQTCGDTHLWYVWHGKQPFEWYRSRQDRFCSEFGFQSFPEPAVIDAVTLPEDRNITSYIMEHYQRSQIGNSTIIHYMLDWFQLPTSFDKMVWLSQILQGLAMKYAIEHWRRNMPRTMGTLYWQHNDMWPAPSWASLDWQGNWKALHYMASRFYAPVLISGLEDKDAQTVEIHISSDSAEEQAGTVHWRVTTAAGITLANDTIDTTIPVRGTKHIDTLDLTSHVAEQGARDLIIWLELRVAGKTVSENLVLLERPKHLTLQKPTITMSTDIQEANRHNITLTSDMPALYVWLELPGAKFSDNFFHLAPGTSRIVEVFAEDVSALRVQSLYDTYQ